MIPAQFDYKAPATLDEAVALLASDLDGAKVLAGGHSLIPAMKLRLAQPQLLVDIARIKSLAYIREEGDQILIGATTTHYQLESSDLLKQICPLLPECAKSIGDVQVRNKGTIGGSIAHSDPAGDWPAAVLALDADLVLVGPNGERTVKAEDFFVDLLTTDLQPGEILREIRIKKPSGRFGQAYQKVPHPASGFAVVGVAVHLVLNDDGSCKVSRYRRDWRGRESVSRHRPSKRHSRERTSTTTRSRRRSRTSAMASIRTPICMLPANIVVISRRCTRAAAIQAAKARVQ